MLHWLRKSPPIEAKSSLADPEDWLIEVFGAQPAASGIQVTPKTAMRSTPVRCAVQAIAEAMGQLPLIVYQRADDGSRERAPDSPAYRLLHDDANEWTSAADFREQLTRDALLHGNGTAFINRIDGQPAELIRLDPTGVTIEPDGASGEPTYKIAEKGQQRPIDRRNVLHIKAPSLDGLKGESPVRQCREAIGVALVLERHAARFFANGARPGGIISLPNKIGVEAVRKMQTAWREAHEGSDNTGRTATLWGGATYVPTAFNSVDAQFLQVWQHAITEIARIFRVPPHLLYELGRATWGNAAEMSATFVRFTLMRWIKAWEGEIRLKLFAPDDRGTFFAEFLLDDFLRADIAARATAYSTLIAARVLNPNECRAMENRAPYAGGDVFANPNVTAGAEG